MSDISKDESANWIPYSKRAEWADVTPLAQDDGEHPVVAIDYSDKFREVYDYFRAILAKREMSPRALALTSDALRLCPSNFTVWQYRRELLQTLKSDLKEELNYTERFILSNTKNYQVWHHRSAIVELLNDGSKELLLTEAALREDAKNYHAWQHRIWAIKKFNLFERELDFVDRLLAEDVRNNSAWNQRFLVNKHTGFSAEVIERELEYAMTRIRLAKNNESAWNYLRGVLRQSGDAVWDRYAYVVEFCEELYNNNIRSPHLLGFLIDLYQQRCLAPEVDSELSTFYSHWVLKLCEEMSNEHDVIRRKYWQYVAEKFKATLFENNAI